MNSTWVLQDTHTKNKKQRNSVREEIVKTNYLEKCGRALERVLIV